jgi:lipoate-protein ligase A
VNLSVLPIRTAGAAENMAVDFLLLQRWTGPVAPRFRHYEWRAPAFTFGYGQKIAFIRGELPVTEGVRFDLCRRPTGGGLVDHRDDWTYALVIPRGHPLEEGRATESYRVVHASIAEALQMQGVGAKLATVVGSVEPVALTSGICFQNAEVHDVIGADGAKIAGAAQKRTKPGLLFQGSISRRAAGPAVDWDRFETDFPALLARELGGAPQPAGWPDFHEDEVEGLAEQYAAPEWTEAR